MTAPRVALALAALAVAAACAAGGPRPIAFGTEPCAHCHMTIVDPRHAAVLVTTTGRQYAFDDPGCLAAFVADGRVPADRVRGAWFHAFLEPGAVLPAAAIRLVRSDTLRTPMGSGLVAARAGAQADSLRRLVGGTVLTWEAARARRGP